MSESDKARDEAFDRWSEDIADDMDTRHFHAWDAAWATACTYQAQVTRRETIEDVRKGIRGIPTDEWPDVLQDVINDHMGEIYGLLDTLSSDLPEKTTEAVVGGLMWSNTLPTEPGFYWAEWAGRGGQRTIVSVDSSPSRIMWHGSLEIMPFEFARFAGPIQEPSEAPE